MLAYARKHPELRHRELAWRRVDEHVACLSPSRVYRIHKEANRVCPGRRRAKRKRAEEAKATRPNQRRVTDLRPSQVGEGICDFVSLMDAYARYLGRRGDCRDPRAARKLAARAGPLTERDYWWSCDLVGA